MVLRAVMKMRFHLVPLIFLLTSPTGVFPHTLQEIYVKVGDMAVLQCPVYKGYKHGDGKVTWTSDTTQEMDLTNMSSDEQRQIGVLLHERRLVILRASVDHQGNYSCSTGNASRQSWFSVTVYTTLPRELEGRTQYPATCFAQESCRLNCPDVNIPAVNSLNITSNGRTWHKEGESLLEVNPYFSSVEEEDHGVYTCTRSYLYHGQIYNKSFTVVLDVKPKENDYHAVIISPRENEVFHVDLGSRVEIECVACMYSNTSPVFWLSGGSFVEKDKSLPVFYKSRWENCTEKHGIKSVVSLVFNKVSEDHLSTNYTCKLESESQLSTFVNITLARKASRSYVSVALCSVGIVVVMVVTVVTYMKFKIDITLFLRDSLGCHRSPSDGKTYDAFLMCYKSDTDAGINACDRKCLENVLEERFGYNLCLYDRDVLPGKAVAEAVLDCIEQSRTVVLVPTTQDPDLGSGLLSAIHAALVERETSLILIKTETTEVAKSGSLPEVLQLLDVAGHCVTWEGLSSMPSSSSFWKQLRYHLPAPQPAPQTSLLPNKYII